MVDEVVLNPDKRDLVPINSMMKFVTQKINFIDEFGQEWLKTGYVTRDFASYPAAAVNEGIAFTAVGGLGSYKIAYSPKLKRWVGVNSADMSGGAPTGTTKSVFYSDDNFLTRPTGVISDIICSSLIWSDYHQKFIGTGRIGVTSTYYFIESIDGISWTCTASSYGGHSMKIDENTGNIIAESSGYSRVPHYGHSINGPFTSTGLPSSTAVVFSDPTFGVYCNSSGTLRRTIDGGNTWELVNIESSSSPTPAPTSFAVADGVLYANNNNNSIGYISTDGVNFKLEPRIGSSGLFIAHNSELLSVGSVFVIKYVKIGETISLSTERLAAAGGAISDVIIGDDMLLAVGGRGTSGYVGKLYDTWVGSKSAVDDEFVRIK